MAIEKPNHVGTGKGFDPSKPESVPAEIEMVTEDQPSNPEDVTIKGRKNIRAPK